MSNLQYKITQLPTSKYVGAAIVLRDEEPNQALAQAVQQDLAAETWVEVGGITLHLAAWEDPDHWSEDVVRAFNLGPDEDPWEAVADHLRAAMT